MAGWSDRAMRGAWAQALLPVLALLVAGAAKADTACAAPRLTLTAAKGAMLALSLDAPCQKGGRVTLAHAGFRFSVGLDAGGHYQVTLPALDAAGQVMATLGDGQVLQAAQPVGDLGEQRRLALQRPATMRLSGSGAARLTLLGDASLPDPLLVQVADIPSDPGKAMPLALIADVTAQNCGHDLMVHILRSGAKLPVQSDAVLMSMPACGADILGTHLSLDLGAALPAAAP